MLGDDDAAAADAAADAGAGADAGADADAAAGANKEMHKKVLRIMMAAAARRGHRVPMVAAAAATIACSGSPPSAVEERLTGLRVAACALRGCKLSEADRHWLDLTGVSGNPKRSPRVMLSAFDCGGDSQFRLMLLLSEGGDINVSVPDPWLGALILACNT